MSLLGNGIEYLEIDDYNDSEGGGVDHRISRLGGGGEVPHTMEAEKRIRREIANSNERRRMQSINAGFQSLRTLLPRHEGEKLSKAAILQQTAEYIYALEQEKTRLLSQNCQLKRLLNQHEGGDIPIKKRKAETIISDCPVITETEELVENIKPEPVAIISVSEAPSPNSEITDLRLQLDRERRFRMVLEDQVRTMESQIYSDPLRDMPHQITLQYESAETVDADEAELRELEEGAEVIEGLDAVEAMEPAGSPVNMVVEGAGRAGSLLEAAIKAEPKVEVEVLSEGVAGPVAVAGQVAGGGETGEAARLYLASTSRQNLETIVEAIRHLEGDHLFAEEAQEAPLALTHKPDPRRLRLEMDELLHFRPQARPGVIVVKHS